jgi:hypothetical protein
MASQPEVKERPIRVGVFDTVGAADHAVNKLLSAGFNQQQITVVCSDEVKEQYFKAYEHQQPAGAKAPAAAAIETAVGLPVPRRPVHGRGKAVWGPAAARPAQRL